MNIKTGVDIVYLPRFRTSLKRGGAAFLQRVYLPQELKDKQSLSSIKQSLSSIKRTTRLAGIFTSKEAVIKALDLPAGSWHDIQITHNSKGAPRVHLLTSQLSHPTSSSLSISHDGNYVIAHFVVILK
ncbi:MAG: holo-ACP synthase [Candidatus Blackburnbacteria bacterium]|nr:holo-ACP synthase [Candidatus Blackburnbacteria bacterium]